ncbi:MAG: RND transporter [Phycisphaerae bacterium]
MHGRMTKHLQPSALLTAALAPLLLAPTMLAGCGPSPSTPQGPRPEAPPVKVSLGPVQRQPLPETVEVSGTLFADEDVVVSAKQPGRIASIHVDVGDVATPGQTLAQIDPRDYELALHERQAALDAALAEIGLAELPGESFDESTLPAVVKAKAEAANAEARYQRAKRLSEQTPPLIAEQDFADIRTQWEVAASQSEVELLSARASLAAARAQDATVATARQRLADTTITAPLFPNRADLSLKVAERLVSVGEYVQAGVPMFRLVAPNLIKFRAAAPERFAARIREGQQVQLVDADTEDAPRGTVARISPVINPANRTFMVEIHFENTGGLLKAGAYANGRIVVGVRENALLVPARAVVTFAGVHRVFTVADGKAVEHRVQLGNTHADAIEIIGDIPADQVIISGLAGVNAGRAVEVVTPTP